MKDHRGVTLAPGDRVVPIRWGGGIPLWLASSYATVTALGRTRLHVHFDGYAYRDGDRPHTAPPTWFRKIGETS